MNESGTASSIPFIFKRSFLGTSIGFIIFAPLIIIYVLIKYFPNFQSQYFSMNLFNAQGDMVIPPILVFVIIYMLIAGIYAFIIDQIQFLERVIRIYIQNSRQDSKTISIAKKIFRNSVVFKISIFFRYYSIGALLSLISIGYGFYSVYIFSVNENQDVMSVGYKLIGVAVVIFFTWIYIHYYLSAKLRYAWFAYLNNYGDDNSSQRIFKEINDLNTVYKSEMFRKSLVGEIKSDTAADAARFGTGALLGNFQTSSILGNQMKEVTGGYVAGVAGDIGSYNILNINFDLYKKAYTQFYGKDFTSNTNLL